ncbi:hypothetical protein RDABS01_006443, partial [Bienertia sinuspersici]
AGGLLLHRGGADLLLQGEGGRVRERLLLHRGEGGPAPAKGGGGGCCYTGGADLGGRKQSCCCRGEGGRGEGGRVRERLLLHRGEGGPAPTQRGGCCYTGGADLGGGGGGGEADLLLQGGGREGGADLGGGGEQTYYCKGEGGRVREDLLLHKGEGGPAPGGNKGMKPKLVDIFHSTRKKGTSLPNVETTKKLGWWAAGRGCDGQARWVRLVGRLAGVGVLVGRLAGGGCSGGQLGRRWIAQKVFNSKLRDRVVGFGGGMKVADLRGQRPSREELEAELNSTKKQNQILQD